MKMNPILASGARRRMRSWKTPFIVSLYGLTLLVFAMLYLAPLSRESLLVNDMQKGLECYIFLIVLQFFLTILVAPAMTAGSISGERERQTLELLLVTNTGSLRITFGKLMENFAFIALLILSSTPSLCIVFMTGGISILQLCTSILFMLVCAFASQCIGIFSSALCKRTVAATVLSYLMLLLIGVGTLALAAYATFLFAIDYDAALVMSAEEIMERLAWILYCNPGLGLLALLGDQTFLLEGTIRSLFGYSSIAGSLVLSRIVWMNMLFMLTAGFLFVFLAALLVRPGKNKIRKRKRA